MIQFITTKIFMQVSYSQWILLSLTIANPYHMVTNDNLNHILKVHQCMLILHHKEV